MAETFRIKDATIIWHEKSVIKALDAETKKRMQMALVYLQNKTRKNVSITAVIIKTGEAVKSKRSLEKHRKRKEPLRRHSKKGEFPFVITGQLRRRIFRSKPYIQGKRILGNIGTTLDYGIYHELHGRSYLRRTAEEEKRKIGRILAGQKA